MGKGVLSAIVARASDGAIGASGDLPWHIPDDLKYFKAVTLGKPVIMGRKTYESIGRPLPNRRNIVITRQTDFDAPKCDIASSLQAAIALVAGVPEVMIIGGGALYAEALVALDRLYITEVDTLVDGADTFFPDIKDKDWIETKSEYLAATDARPALTFRVLDRR